MHDCGSVVSDVLFSELIFFFWNFPWSLEIHKLSKMTVFARKFSFAQKGAKCQKMEFWTSDVPEGSDEFKSPHFYRNSFSQHFQFFEKRLFRFLFSSDFLHEVREIKGSNVT